MDSAFFPEAACVRDDGMMAISGAYSLEVPCISPIFQASISGKIPRKIWPERTNAPTHLLDPGDLSLIPGSEKAEFFSPAPGPT